MLFGKEVRRENWLNINESFRFNGMVQYNMFRWSRRVWIYKCKDRIVFYRIWLWVVVCGCTWWYVIVCGGMWWYVIVCDGMWWYVMVCTSMLRDWKVYFKKPEWVTDWVSEKVTTREAIASKNAFRVVKRSHLNIVF